MLIDKPVARHFNTANHSISDIKVCAISPISGGNGSRKGVSFLKLEPFIPTGSTNDFLLFDPFKVFVFLQHLLTFSLHYVHPPPTYLLRASASLLIDFKNGK